MTKRFEDFVGVLGDVVGIGLKPDRHGVVLVRFGEEGVEVLFELDEQLVPQTVLMSSAVGAYEVGREKEVCEAVLQSNGEVEETVSVKPDEQLIYVHRRVYPEIGLEELRGCVESLKALVKSWREKVRAIEQGPTETPKPSGGIEMTRYKA